jgi:hypothetical protein
MSPPRKPQILHLATLKLNYSSIQVSNVLVLTVRFQLVNLVFQIFPLFIPEMSTSFTSYIVQIVPIYFTSLCRLI